MLVIMDNKEARSMKLSTRGLYGTRALLELALRGGEEPVLLKDIAQRQQISLSYLQHLVAPLIAGGIIRSTRGAKGGISLVRPPEQIRLSEVIQLLEGSTAPVECVDNPMICKRSALCVSRDIWGELKKVMDEVLESITLQDLAERQKGKEQLMYYI
jgi:Rrf2 family cysteine metabolism transcriptional repressor